MRKLIKGIDLKKKMVKPLDNFMIEALFYNIFLILKIFFFNTEVNISSKKGEL